MRGTSESISFAVFQNVRKEPVLILGGEVFSLIMGEKRELHTFV